MSDALELWHLPGLDADDPALCSGWVDGRTVAGRAFQVPAPTAEGAARITGEVRRAALQARRERSLAEVVQAAATAAGRLAEVSTEAGGEAVRLVADEQGWSEPLAQETLAEMGRIWTEESLWSVLRSELRDPLVLEGFRVDPEARDGLLEASWGERRRRASGPPLLFQIMAGNVPGVAVTAVMRGLLVRSGVLTKLSEEEPGLVVLFARQLAEVDPLLALSLAAMWWPAEEEHPLWSEWTAKAGRLVVYGGEAAVLGVRGRARPDQEIITYGPKLGVGVILPGADVPAAAGALARDVCAYEQQGCVSPRLVFVLGSAEPFAKELAGALARETERIPRRPLRPEEAVATRSARAEVEFRGYAHGASRVLASERDLAWTVLLDDPPCLEVESLPRVVRVSRVGTLEILKRLIQPLSGRIQALGYAGDGGLLRLLAEVAADLGVGRLAPLGRLAWPPADWRHDGRYQLLPLLTWTDWEAE